MPVMISVRFARPGDGAGLVALHAEMAEFYAEFAPHHFRRPDTHGFGETLDLALRSLSSAELALVAETGATIVGALWATLMQPSDDAARQIEQESSLTRVRIEYVVTAADRRREGVAGQLVEAAEEWGRKRGAALTEASTYRPSPLSFPFWTERMGYEERSVNLQKRL